MPAMTEIVIDLTCRTVTRDGVAVNLPLTQFNMLVYLARTPLAVRSRDQMREAVGRVSDCNDRAVDCTIKRLRRAGFAGMIRSHYGAGYAWVGARPIFKASPDVPIPVIALRTMALQTEPCRTLDEADAALAHLVRPYVKTGWRIASWVLSWPDPKDPAHGFATLNQTTTA